MIDHTYTLVQCPTNGRIDMSLESTEIQPITVVFKVKVASDENVLPCKMRIISKVWTNKDSPAVLHGVSPRTDGGTMHFTVTYSPLTGEGTLTCQSETNKKAVAA